MEWLSSYPFLIPSPFVCCADCPKDVRQTLQSSVKLEKGLRSASTVGQGSLDCVSPSRNAALLRRGGGTRHFSSFGNVDLTTQYGRRALARAARLYCSGGGGFGQCKLCTWTG